MVKIVIIGNSLSGFSAVDALRQSANQITVISKENYPAYDRNKLVDFLSGSIKEKDLFLCDSAYYEASGISLFLGSEISRVDTRKQRLILKNNSRIDYNYLLIASGERIELPDIPGKSKDGIFSLYTLDGAKKISERLLISDTVCIIGGGQNLNPLVKCIIDKGKEVKVISQEALSIQEERIEMINNAAVQEFIGEGQLQAVKLDNGKVIGVDLAIFISPHTANTAFLKETDIKLEQGYIAVDDNMCTNIENIFSCGKVTNRQADGKLAAQAILNSLERGKFLCQQTS